MGDGPDQRLHQQLERRGASTRELESADEALDPEALTIGFARRFATYKRAPLVFRPAIVWAPAVVVLPARLTVWLGFRDRVAFGLVDGSYATWGYDRGLRTWPVKYSGH